MKLVYQYPTLGPDMNPGEMRCLMHDKSHIEGHTSELALAFHDTWSELQQARKKIKALKDEIEELELFKEVAMEEGGHT